MKISEISKGSGTLNIDCICSFRLGRGPRRRGMLTMYLMRQLSHNKVQ